MFLEHMGKSSDLVARLNGPLTLQGGTHEAGTRLALPRTAGGRRTDR